MYIYIYFFFIYIYIYIYMYIYIRVFPTSRKFAHSPPTWKNSSPSQGHANVDFN